jgi:hypothetical protein
MQRRAAAFRKCAGNRCVFIDLQESLTFSVHGEIGARFNRREDANGLARTARTASEDGGSGWSRLWTGYGRRQLERETGIEPATNSLEGCDSTTELLPLVFVFNTFGCVLMEQPGQNGVKWRRSAQNLHKVETPLLKCTKCRSRWTHAPSALPLDPATFFP